MKLILQRIQATVSASANTSSTSRNAVHKVKRSFVSARSTDTGRCSSIPCSRTEVYRIAKRGIARARDAPVIVDMRSDTVTLPCNQLRDAMANAPVGDDVYGEDPSVNQLQDYAANVCGMEAALFVPSGTMGNLIAVGVHCQRGDEMILGSTSHMFKYEGGGASAFMGVSYACIPNQHDGTLSVSDIQAAIREDDDHCPRTSLICLENTHNYCGGVPLPLGYVQQVCELASKRGLKVHVDGARLLNAAIAHNKKPRELLEGVDSASICLSKGLGSPAGSILLGTSSFIKQAKRLRKALGGGMRQSGILAAAGLEAWINNYRRLAEDHAHAELFAHELESLGCMQVLNGIRKEEVSNAIRTNMVYFDLTEKVAMSAETFVESLASDHGVLLGGGYGLDGRRMRAVMHLGVSKEQVHAAVSAMRQVLKI